MHSPRAQLEQQCKKNNNNSACVQYCMLLVQMVEVVLLGSDPDLHLLFSIKSLRERIEGIISYIFSLASSLMSLTQKALLWLCIQ